MRTKLFFVLVLGDDEEETTRSEIIMSSTELLVHPVLPFLAARDVTKGRLHLWQVSGSAPGQPLAPPL